MKTLLALLLLLVSSVASAQDTQDKRMKFFDKELMPRLRQGGALEGDTLRDLASMVHTFNNMTPVMSKEVVQLKPHFLSTYLNEEGVTTAALALCAANIEGLNSCEAAAAHLQTMTAQCSSVFLGTIDLDAYPDVPLDKFDAEFGTEGDPNLILMAPNPDVNHARTTVRVAGAATLDTVALVLCPSESEAFGHVFRLMTGR